MRGLAASQRPHPRLAMRKVQGLFTAKPGVNLELPLMQEPDTIHSPRQVTGTTACILGIGCAFPACQLSRMVNQDAGTRVLRVVGGAGTNGIDNGALLLTHIFLKATQFAEAINNNETGLY